MVAERQIDGLQERAPALEAPSARSGASHAAYTPHDDGAEGKHDQQQRYGDGGVSRVVRACPPRHRDGPTREGDGEAERVDEGGPRCPTHAARPTRHPIGGARECACPPRSARACPAASVSRSPARRVSDSPGSGATPGSAILPLPPPHAEDTGAQSGDRWVSVKTRVVGRGNVRSFGHPGGSPARR